MHATETFVTTEISATAFSSGRKITSRQKLQVWQMLKNDQQCPTSHLFTKVTEFDGSMDISVRQVNRYRVKWGFNRGKGRPRKSDSFRADNQNKDLVIVRPNVSYVGLHLFDDWLEQQEVFSELIGLLKDVIEKYKIEHPAESFPLLGHKVDTLKYRFKALLYAPLFGIGKLTEYDLKEHALQTIIGRSYQSSTLNQFLGQLERVDVAEALMPSLNCGEQGSICYIDGHMIAFWTRLSMHKGKITMLGRIMAGSNAMVSHNEQGNAIFVQYFPPDMRMPKVILDYCEKIVSLTGIKLFVIDREVNSLAVASAFESKQWGLISMLDKNEYKDLSDWYTEEIGKLEDGSTVYSGKWKGHEGDLREFVIVEKEGKLLPYWGTPKAKELLDQLNWPKIYSQRNEIQENSFRRMIDHGALNINYGIKKIVSADRHQERKRTVLEDKSTALKKKIDKKTKDIESQEEKVSDSMEKSHGKRLSQRENKLAEMRTDLKEINEKSNKINEQIDSLGPSKQRADRDFRKQTIMTIRTLFLENALMAFIITLLENLNVPLSQKCIIELLLKRSGGFFENCSEIIYWIDANGLSKSFKQSLESVINGLNAMNLHRNGKPIRVKSRASP
jgi:hypothetical protein